MALARLWLFHQAETKRKVEEGELGLFALLWTCALLLCLFRSKNLWLDCKIGQDRAAVIASSCLWALSWTAFSSTFWVI